MVLGFCSVTIATLVEILERYIRPWSDLDVTLGNFHVSKLIAYSHCRTIIYR